VFAIGTALNVVAVVTGGLLGLIIQRDLAPATQGRLRSFIGLAIVIAGFHMIWTGLEPAGLGRAFGLIGTALLATMIGRPLGRLLHVQAGMNRLGRWAGTRFMQAREGRKIPFHDGFMACAILFCVGPLSVLGPLQEGLSGNFPVLAVKAAMDGLAAFAFTRGFRSAVILAGIPLLALQGTLTLLALWLARSHLDPYMVHSLNVTGGLLVVCATLLVFEVQKFEMGDYLPALLVAPLLAALFF